MTRTHRRAVLPFLGFCWLAAGLAVVARADGTKRPITAKDLLRFTWAADPRIAPDGSRVAFVKVAVDAEKDDYITSIWLVPIPRGGQRAEPRRLTNGPRDASPRWSPDGTRLVFARVDREGREAAAAPALPAVVRRGRAQAAHRPAQGGLVAGLVARRQDLAFLSGTTPEDLDRARRVKKGEKPERESDVRVVTREEFRRDNAGYRDALRPNHIWTIAVPGPGPGERPPTSRPSRAG